MALVPPRQLAMSKEPAARASVCLAPELISGNVTLVPSFSNPFTMVWFALSTMLGMFRGCFTYVTLRSFSRAAAFFSGALGALPPQPARMAVRVNSVNNTSTIPFFMIFPHFLINV